MSIQDQYIEVNKQLWNERVDHHVASDFYNVDGFVAGASSLNDIELDLLRDVSGKSLLHLQCHFGQDTISLARLGATTTGVDFSEAAVAKATELAQQLSAPASFVCCNVYDTRQYITDTFDIVFTSYGTVGWLPDLKPWAKVVADSLKPGGIFVFAEFHPVVWMFDNAFTHVAYSYFNTDPIVEEEEGTYANTAAPIKTKSVGWNHSIDEVLQSLIDAGLQLQVIREYDYSPYNIFQNSVEMAPGQFGIQGMERKLPLVYALRMVKD